MVKMKVLSTGGQECPEIYIPPYGDKPRECQTSIGSTCLITCPDDFEIIGSCFRTCVLHDDITQIYQNSELKLKRKVSQPFTINLRPKKIGFFLPASSINKMISSGKQATCCNEPYRESKRSESTDYVKLRNQNLNSHSETCPNHSLPEHHLLHSLAKQVREQEEIPNARQQNVPKWSGTKTYCVNTDVQCPDLDPPTDGFFFYCLNYAGLSCAIGCQSGFRLIGSRVLLCTRQGTWSDALPTCQQI